MSTSGQTVFESGALSGVARTFALPANVVVGVVEDDPDQSAMISALLTDAGCRTVCFANARDFRRRLGAESVDILLLDWMLPDQSGLELLAWLRNSAHLTLPVIMLTVRREEGDIVAALQAGADDYLVKPAREAELLVRISALLRRTGIGTAESAAVSLPPYELDSGRREVRVAGEVVSLTEREFDLAYFLFRRPGRVVSRDALLQHVWNVDASVNTRTVDTHASRIRRKLGLDGTNGWQLSAVYQHGYRLEHA